MDNLHPRRWSVKRTQARCELCGVECSELRLEVRADLDSSVWCCPGHALAADVVHPIRPDVYMTLTSPGLYGEAANDNNDVSGKVARNG